VQEENHRFQSTSLRRAPLLQPLTQAAARLWQGSLQT
jgi:hypothetical protein